MALDLPQRRLSRAGWLTGEGPTILTWTMTIQAVKDVLARQPIEPFRVILSSGDRYEVRHPEFAWPVKGGL
jgi:hypothetical protein